MYGVWRQTFCTCVDKANATYGVVCGAMGIRERNHKGLIEAFQLPRHIYTRRAHMLNSHDIRSK